MKILIEFGFKKKDIRVCAGTGLIIDIVGTAPPK
jgi:hypothetical protein